MLCEEEEEEEVGRCEKWERVEGGGEASSGSGQEANERVEAVLGTLPGEQIGGDESGLRLVGRCARVAAVGDAMLVVVVVVVDGEETVGDIAEMCVCLGYRPAVRGSQKWGEWFRQLLVLDAYVSLSCLADTTLYAEHRQGKSARGQSRRVSRLHDDLKRKRTRKTR